MADEVGLTTKKPEGLILTIYRTRRTLTLQRGKRGMVGLLTSNTGIFNPLASVQIREGG